MADQSVGLNPPLAEDLGPGVKESDLVNSDGNNLRGVPEASKDRKPPEDVNNSDDIDAVFKLHDQICSAMESAISKLRDTFPLFDQLNKKMSEGNAADYRLDRRLRILSLIQTVMAAHTHLNKAAHSARVIAITRRDELDEIHLSPFE